MRPDVSGDTDTVAGATRRHRVLSEAGSGFIVGIAKPMGSSMVALKKVVEATRRHRVLVEAGTGFIVTPMGPTGDEGAGMAIEGITGIKGWVPIIPTGRTVSTTGSRNQC